MNRHIPIHGLACIFCCLTLLIFSSRTSVKKLWTLDDSAQSVLFETEATPPDSESGLNVFYPSNQLAPETINSQANGYGVDGVAVARKGTYMPLSLPVAHRTLGFKERMLERAAMLTRAISSLERGPPTPSWSWETLEEDKREDPVLDRDASYIQASTSQQVANLLRKNLADADAELRARRRLAAKAAASMADESPSAAPPPSPKAQQPRASPPRIPVRIHAPDPMPLASTQRPGQAASPRVR